MSFFTDKDEKINRFTTGNLTVGLKEPEWDPKKDNDGKNLYKVLSSNLYKSGIDEDRFVMYLCDDIFDYEDLSKFTDTLSTLLS